MTYYEEENWPRYLKLKNKVANAIFEDGGHFILKTRASERFDGDAEELKEFKIEYTKILWGHLEALDPGAAKALEKELEENWYETENQIEKHLKKLGCSDGAVKKSIEILQKDFFIRLNDFTNPINNPKSDYRFHFGKDPGKHVWKKAENHIIKAIYSLYTREEKGNKKPSLIDNDDNIMYNMARAFLAIEFWPPKVYDKDPDDAGLPMKQVLFYYEKLKRRFRKIKEWEKKRNANF